MFSLLKRVIGSSNDRQLRHYQGRVGQINDLERQFESLKDVELRAKTEDFRARVANGESLDRLLPEAFATVREAAKRTLGQRHYDVQLVGGMVLHDGAIAEMRTGEGKTLVATLASYLNALAGKGVHVITVNDYLAQRDAEWMGQVHRFLGLEVGCIISGMPPHARKAAYAADITYGTNNEFGFDYLRDNLVYERAEMVQRGHHFAIVDEVDSILIDEARTPLIISGPTDDRSEFYRTMDQLILQLSDNHFELNEKDRQVMFTEEGAEFLEDLMRAEGLLEGDLYDAHNVSTVHHANQALRAHKMFNKDKDYIVKDGEVMLIDEFTGRMMAGRRLSDGLHQAIEAKEHVDIKPENQTLASVTLQNYFRMYGKLSGMTGTAATEAAEFMDIYKMGVVEIPTNKPIQRIDHEDEVYRTEREKYNAMLEQISDCYKRRQPILVGTASIEKSESLSEFLKQKNIPHKVLNARYHEQEAQIVAQAGVPGAVTIATNMAGRGTDIQLGGNLDMRMAAECPPDATDEQKTEIREKLQREIENLKREALDAGGLFVLGSERHESRRIDNQLRGRTGRQGDPGTSKYYLSFQDDLLRIFAADRLEAIVGRLGLEEGEVITHKWLTKAIETAQKRVEARNYDMRKNLLKYDDVINDQRKAIFEQRQDVLDSEDLKDVISDFRYETAEDIVSRHMPPKTFAEQWDIPAITAEAHQTFGFEMPLADWAKEDGVDQEDILKRMMDLADEAYEKREALIGEERLRHLERAIILQSIDHSWREHLLQLDHLRSVVGLRGYAQRDPLNEYKSEAFSLFEAMLVGLRQQVTRTLMTLEIITQPPEDMGNGINLQVKSAPKSTEGTPPEGKTAPAAATPTPPAASAAGNVDEDVDEDDEALPEGAALPPDARLPDSWKKTGRNAPCPCGSGRKFKHCHGTLTNA